MALGTDFNPNAFCLAMPVVMHLAAVNLKMSLTETLAAATINAAQSIGRSKTHGSIERGKIADLLVLNASKWEHLIYQLGGFDQVIKYVVKKGKIVFWIPAEFIFGLFVMLCLSISVFFLEIQFFFGGQYIYWLLSFAFLLLLFISR